MSTPTIGYAGRESYKVSELISDLQKFLAEHGDLKVVAEQYGDYGTMTPHTLKKEDGYCVLDGI
jgi:hypothetical protein